MTECPTTDCTISPDAGSAWWAAFVDPPAWAWLAVVAIVVLGLAGIAWGLRRDGLYRATKRQMLENNAVLFCALLGTGLLAVWLPLWAAAAVGGPGGYLVGMRAASVASAELWADAATT